MVHAHIIYVRIALLKYQILSYCRLDIFVYLCDAIL